MNAPYLGILSGKNTQKAHTDSGGLRTLPPPFLASGRGLALILDAPKRNPTKNDSSKPRFNLHNDPGGLFISKGEVAGGGRKPQYNCTEDT